MGVSRVLEVSHKGVRGITQAFQGCYKSLTRMLQGCYKGVTTVLLSLYKNVVRVFHWCSYEVIRVLHGRHKGASWVSQGCTRVFQWSDKQECHIRIDMFAT